MGFQCCDVGPQSRQQQRQNISFTENFGGNAAIATHNFFNEFCIRQVAKWRMRVGHMGRPPRRYHQKARQPLPPSGQFSRHFRSQDSSHTVTEEDERNIEVGCDGRYDAVHQHWDIGNRRLRHPGRSSGQLHRAHVDLGGQTGDPWAEDGSAYPRIGEAKQPNGGHVARSRPK